MNQRKSSVILGAAALLTFLAIAAYAEDPVSYDSYLPLVTATRIEYPPAAVDDTYSTDENVQLVVPAPGLLENDSDANGDALTAVLVADPAHGTLALSADGSFTYTPAPGYDGADSFTYKASDGALESGVATVSLTINEVILPSCAAAPVLISPADGSTTDTLIPTFQWDNGNVAEVTEITLLILENADDYPAHWLYKATSYSRYFSQKRYDDENLPAGTTFYWQVWQMCGEVEGPHSPLYSFTTGTEGVILPAPTLLSPANGAEIWSADLPVVLTWQPLAGADEYSVSLTRWYAGGWYYVTGWNTTGSAVTINISLMANSSYRWMVQGLNSYALGTTSPAWQFNTRD